MLLCSLVTRSEAPLFSSPGGFPPAPAAKTQTQGRPAASVRRLVEYGWDYDRICYRVEREFPPPASTALERRNHREWIARLIARYRHGESVSPALLQ